MHPPTELRYRRSRFSTRLPLDRLYTPSHYWVLEEEPGLWRVGFTRFATRMLGDFVELEFQPKEGEQIAVGQTIGWIEGFKAVSEVYSAAVGGFAGVNPALEQDITLTDSDPYGDGWLYRVRGEPEQDSVDAHGYAAILDAIVDQMTGQAQDS